MQYSRTNSYLGVKHHVSNNIFEPVRTNNFELLVTLGGDTHDTPREVSLTLSVDKFSAPKISIDTLEVHYGNNLMKYAGKAKFDDCSLTVQDYIGANVETTLFNWFKLAYDPNTQVIGLASEYKKSAKVVEYKPNGEYLRSWTLKGVWIKDMDLGEFTQEGGLRKLNANLVYDYCLPDNMGAANGFADSATRTVE